MILKEDHRFFETHNVKVTVIFHKRNYKRNNWGKIFIQGTPTLIISYQYVIVYMYASEKFIANYLKIHLRINTVVFTFKC